VACLHDHADFAVGLEAADTRTVAGARIDHNKRPARWIDHDACRRHHPHQAVIHRLFELAAVDNELELVIEHMRRGFGEMRVVLIAAFAHHVPEQNAALRSVDGVFDRGGERAIRAY
jgi:hypothetical protein